MPLAFRADRLPMIFYVKLLLFIPYLQLHSLKRTTAAMPFFLGFCSATLSPTISTILDAHRLCDLRPLAANSSLTPTFRYYADRLSLGPSRYLNGLNCSLLTLVCSLPVAFETFQPVRTFHPSYSGILLNQFLQSEFIAGSTARSFAAILGLQHEAIVVPVAHRVQRVLSRPPSHPERRDGRDQPSY